MKGGSGERETVKKIYESIGDGISKRIFASRLLYSLTGDFSHMAWMAEEVAKGAESDERWMSLKCRVLEMREKPYIFGAGIYGKLLFEKMGGAKTFEGFIDNAHGGVQGFP